MYAKSRCFYFRSACFVAAGTTALAISQSARAQQPFFMGLGDLAGGDFWSQPWDISADGSFVVGVSRTVDGSSARGFSMDS